MDSLTQIILGAATGELAAGRKLGRKAMLWGAVGGTIPDLDVMIGGVLRSVGLFDEMDALAFHRGISHSFFFAALAPLALGWVVAWHYRSPGREKRSFIGAVLIYALIAFAINFVFFAIGGSAVNYTVLIGSVLLGGVVIYGLYRRFFKRPLSKVEGDWRDFAAVFFWSIFTHPLLDSCTTYGTQLFQPFSDYRVGFNNIAVADPIYTLPFALCIIASAFFFKHLPVRRYLNIAGIFISSTYLLWTFYNKYQVNSVVEQSLAQQEVRYDRYMTSPTILNNFLWNIVVESDSVFYLGLYSILDKEPMVQDWNILPKRYDLLEGHWQDKSINTLTWFTNGYYNVIPISKDTFQISDLRFGTLGEEAKSADDFVFRFMLTEENGELKARQVEDRPPVEDDTFSKFFDRIKGK